MSVQPLSRSYAGRRAQDEDRATLSGGGMLEPGKTKSVQRLLLWSLPFIAFALGYVFVGIQSNVLVGAVVGVWALGSIFVVDAREARGWAVTLALFSVAILSPINSTSNVRVVGLAAASMAMIIVLLRTPRSQVKWTAQLRTGALLVAAYVAITILSAIGGQTDAGQFLAFLCVFVVAAAMCAMRFTRDDVVVFTFGLFGLALLQVVLGFIEFQTGIGPLWGVVGRTEGPGLRNTFLGSGEFRVLGSLGHPIIYGMVACLVIIFAVDSSLKITRFWRTAFAVVGITMLVLSGTRSAVLALGATLVYLFIVAASSTVARLRNAFVALTGIAFTLLLFPSVLEVLDDSTDYLVNSGSYTHRQGAIEAIPRLLSQEEPLRLLFGTGFNSLSRAYAEGILQNDGLNVPDNQVVTSLVTTGVLGLLVVLGLFANALLRGPKEFRTALLLIAIMFFSFDALVWPVAILLLVVLWSAPSLDVVANTPLRDGFLQSGRVHRLPQRRLSHPRN